MSKPPGTATSEIVVYLVRPGDPVRTYHLSKGASLADFLSLIGTSRADEKVYIQGDPIEEASPLKDGTVVTIVPQSWNGRGNEPWRQISIAFQDDALFEEYMEIIREQRRREYPEEEPGA